MNSWELSGIVCFFWFNRIESIEPSKVLLSFFPSEDVELLGDELGGFDSNSAFNSKIRCSKSLIREFLEVNSVLRVSGSNSGGGPSMDRNCSMSSFWSDLKFGRMVSASCGVAPSSKVSFCFNKIRLVGSQSVAKNASPVSRVEISFA